MPKRYIETRKFSPRDFAMNKAKVAKRGRHIPRQHGRPALAAINSLKSIATKEARK